MSANNIIKNIANYLWKGAWSTTTVYLRNNTVQHNGSGYVCTSSHTSGSTTEPGVGANWTEKWDLFVEGYTTSSIIDLIYPVGSIYISVVSTSPATLFGGTWSAFGAGKTLVGLDSGDTAFDTAEDTGGVKEVTLTAAQSGVPAHTHTVYPYATGSGGGYIQNKTGSNGSSPLTKDAGVFLGLADSNSTANASSAHTNLQPYIVTYMWKRTA